MYYIIYIIYIYKFVHFEIIKKKKARYNQKSFFGVYRAKYISGKGEKVVENEQQILCVLSKRKRPSR